MKNNEFLGKNRDRYVIKRLSPDIVKTYQNKILSLLSEIRLTNTDHTYLDDNINLYPYRSELSYACFHDTNMVALLFSYFKKSDTDTPFDSIYIHRFAVEPVHRNNSVATNILNFCIKKYFDDIFWIKNISIQVTTSPMNISARNLYYKSGFFKFGIKEYENKKDELLLLQRNTVRVINSCNDSIIQNPRISAIYGDSNNLKFYFSTSSAKKKEQFSWLFSLYNLSLDFYDISSYLIEPQIDNSDIESEKMLVSHPIKYASRFIKKKPFIVEDTMLFIEEFNKDYDHNPELPGLDTKRWWRQLENDGVLKLLHNSKKRRAKYVSQIGCYIDAKKYYFGRGELHGTIAMTASITDDSINNFPKTNPWFFHQIFIPDGYNVPLSLLTSYEFTKVDYRRKALENLLNNLENNIQLGNEQFSLI